MAFTVSAPQMLPPAQFQPPPVQQPAYYPPSQFASYPSPYFSNPPGAPTFQYGPPTFQYGRYGSYPAPPNGGFPHHYRQHYLPAPGPRPYFCGRGRGRGVAKSPGGGGGHFECKVCSKEYKSRETYDTHMESHQKVCKTVWPYTRRCLSLYLDSIIIGQKLMGSVELLDTISATPFPVKLQNIQ